ncbi:MAG: hypothetical protein QMD92_04125, partial [bacterium]|nr:hypothetical protein [bacterium]
MLNKNKKTLFLSVLFTILFLLFTVTHGYSAAGDIQVNVQNEFGSSITSEGTIRLTLPGPDGNLNTSGDNAIIEKSGTGIVSFYNNIDFNNGTTDISNGNNFKIESYDLGDNGYLNSTISSTSWSSSANPNSKTIQHQFTIKVTVKNEFGSEITNATATINFSGTSGVRYGSTAVYGIPKPVGSAPGTIDVDGLGSVGYLNYDITSVSVPATADGTQTTYNSSNLFTVKVTVKNEFGSEITNATATINFSGTSGVRYGSTAVYGIPKPVNSTTGTINVTNLGSVGFLNYNITSVNVPDTASSPQTTCNSANKFTVHITTNREADNTLLSTLFVSGVAVSPSLGSSIVNPTNADDFGCTIPAGTSYSVTISVPQHATKGYVTSIVSDTAPSASAANSQTKESQNKFGLKVVIADELGGNIDGAMNVGNINTKTYAATTPTYAPAGGTIIYWANTLGTSSALVLNKVVSTTAGYINANVTNTGFNSFATSQSNQTIINLGTYSKATSISTGSINNVKGMEFGLKIYNRDEIDEQTNNFYSTNCTTYTFATLSPTTSNGYYYYWANTAASLSDLDIQRVGFVDYQVTHTGVTGANGITITPSAGQVFINMNGANILQSTSITTGGTYNIEGLQYSLKVIVKDELGETDLMNGCTVSYTNDVGSNLINIYRSVNNYYHIAPNAVAITAGDLRVTRNGYVTANEAVDSTMDHISTDDSTGQLVVTLTGHNPNNSNTTAITSGSISIRGMYFTIKVLGNTDEWNNRLYMRSSNTLFSISTKVKQEILEDTVSTTSGYYRGYVAAGPTTGEFKIQTYGYVQKTVNVTVVDTAQITITFDDNNNAGHNLNATNNTSYNNTPAPLPAPAGVHYDTYGLNFTMRVLGATNELANKINLTPINTTFTSNDTDLYGFTIITDQNTPQVVKVSATSEEGCAAPTTGYGFVAAKQQDFNSSWNGALTIRVTDYNRGSVATTSRWSNITYVDYDSGDYTSQFLAGMGIYIPGNDGDALVGLTGGLPPAAPNFDVLNSNYVDNYINGKHYVNATPDADSNVPGIQIPISGTADKWSAVQVFVNNLSQDNIYWYNGSYIDETSDAANGTINDIVLGSSTTNHALYIGNIDKFDRIHLKISTPGSIDGRIAWEYYNNSSWVTLSATDGTEESGASFRKSGVVSFTKPSNWAATNVNGTTKYWIRARTSTSYNTTIPLGDEVITTFTADGITGSFSKNITLTEGNHTIYANARDDVSSGPGPNSSSFSVVLDTVSPSPSGASVSINGGAAYSKEKTLTITWSGFTDATSGITGYYYSFTNNQGTTNGTYTTTTTGTLTNAPEGTVTVYVWAKDAAGNIGNSANDSIIVDTIAPSAASANVSIDNGAA